MAKSSERDRHDNPPVEKLLYSINDAAFALSLSRRSINYLIANRKLTVRRFGSRRLIPAGEIRRLARMDTIDGTAAVPESAGLLSA